MGSSCCCERSKQDQLLTEEVSNYASNLTSKSHKERQTNTSDLGSILPNNVIMIESTDNTDDILSDDDIYVIGSNLNCELSFSHKQYEYMKELIKLKWYQTKFIKDIHCGCCVNIYINNRSQQYWICGINDMGQCGIGSDIQYVDKLWDINYFQRQNIKIKNIFCNISGRCIFWQTYDNKIYGHGDNQYYQLGLNQNDNKFEPVPISIIPFRDRNNTHITSIKCAEKYSIALCNDGNVYCSGDIKHANYYNDQNKQWRIMDIFKHKKIVNIQCGYSHSLFLENNGVLSSIGKNNYYQLGFGDLENNKYILSKPVEIKYFLENGIKIKDIKCGNDFNLVITEYHKIYSFGYNQDGQCCDGRTEHVKIPQLINSLKEYDVKNIECGALHSYCSTFDDQHFLWGSNEYNECLVFDDEIQKVLLPNLINKIIDNEANGKRINKVLMGWENTIIIVS